jgi:hypothetical protein
MKIKTVILSFFIMSLFFCGCELYKNEYYNNQLKELVDINRDKWNDAGIVNYSYDVYVLYYGKPTESYNISAHVNVNNSVLTIDYGSGSISNEEKNYMNDRVKTIEGYFELIDKAISSNAESINISFNDKSGYPQSIHITNDKNHIEESVIADIQYLASF